MYWLLPAALVAAATAFGGYTSQESVIAQPGPEDPCADALGSVLGALPDLGRLIDSGVGGPAVNINSGNNISIQTGPSNVTPGQSSSVGNNDSQNTSNVSTCCINGRCCVSTDGGAATCTP